MERAMMSVSFMPVQHLYPCILEKTRRRLYTYARDQPPYLSMSSRQSPMFSNGGQRNCGDAHGTLCKEYGRSTSAAALRKEPRWEPPDLKTRARGQSKY